MQATRYHSLAAKLNSLPAELEITSRTETGIVMGLRHREYALESVQYHPESILSEEGKLMLGNFLNLTSGLWSGNPGFENSGTRATPAWATNGSLPIPPAAALPTI